MQHWLNTKQTGSGYRSTSGPSFLKSYSSIACNMTLIHDKCAVGWTTLGRNLVNVNLKLIKPKPDIWPQNLETFEKSNKNRYHEMCNHCSCIQPKQMVPNYGKSQHENHSHSNTRLPDYHNSAAIVTNSTLYTNCLSFSDPIHKNKV